MSSPDGRVGPSAPMVRRTNPRAARTRAMVLAAARTLIAEVGLAGFSYTSVAERSGVTRQTLYRHWPQREELLREILLEGPDNYQQACPLEIRRTLLEALHRYVEWMEQRGNATLVLALMNRADTDEEAGVELADLVERARDDLNCRLRPTAYSVDSVGFSMLLGPVSSRRFLDRAPITTEFLELTVDRFLCVPLLSGAWVREPGRPAAKV